MHGHQNVIIEIIIAFSFNDNKSIIGKYLDDVLYDLNKTILKVLELKLGYY